MSAFTSPHKNLRACLKTNEDLFSNKGLRSWMTAPENRRIKNPKVFAPARGLCPRQPGVLKVQDGLLKQALRRKTLEKYPLGDSLGKKEGHFCLKCPLRRHSRESGNPVFLKEEGQKPFAFCFGWISAFAGMTPGKRRVAWLPLLHAQKRPMTVGHDRPAGGGERTAR